MLRLLEPGLRVSLTSAAQTGTVLYKRAARSALDLVVLVQQIKKIFLSFFFFTLVTCLK